MSVSLPDGIIFCVWDSTKIMLEEISDSLGCLAKCCDGRLPVLETVRKIKALT